MATESTIIQRLMGAIHDQQTSIAEAGMLRPETEVLRYGVQAGKYQGLQMALDILSDILSDNDEKERA